MFCHLNKPDKNGQTLLTQEFVEALGQEDSLL